MLPNLGGVLFFLWPAQVCADMPYHPVSHISNLFVLIHSRYVVNTTMPSFETICPITAAQISHILYSVTCEKLHMLRTPVSNAFIPRQPFDKLRVLAQKPRFVNFVNNVCTMKEGNDQDEEVCRS